ncbi:MAG: DUF1549 domain-containing protein, partial [Planctomycetaceae bacterium]|nr:DUF1549 domain-containing protein [Planctomycetaceae bacterium]
MRAVLTRTFCSLLLAAGATPLVAAEITPQQRDFFETRVRPLLASKCYSCHSQKAKAVKGGLLLDSQAGLAKGGDSGPAVIPGQPDKSLLIAAIQYRDTEMPPDGKLSKSQIATLVQWVVLGAPWPAETSTGLPSQTRQYNWQELRQEHWAWQPVQRPDFPTVQDPQWVKNPIDFFVLAQLEANKLQHVATADKRSLIRRAYFDLIGLPPRPEDIAAFLTDTRPDAYVRL